MITKIRNLMRCNKGQGLTEYIIIVALIAISAIAVVSAFGTQLKNHYSTAVKQLKGVSSKSKAGKTKSTKSKVADTLKTEILGGDDGR